MIVRVLTILVLIGGGVTEVGAKKIPWFDRSARVESESFGLSLEGMRPSALENLKVHQKSHRDLILFLPGAQAPKRSRIYKEGPIKSLKIRKIKRGVVVRLRARERSRSLKKRLHISLDAEPQLTFGLKPTPDKVTSPAKNSGHQKYIGSNEPVRLSDSQEKVQLKPPTTALPQPKKPVSAKAKTLPWAKNETSRTQNKAGVIPAGSGKPSMAASGMLGILLLGCLTTIWAFRRKKTQEKTVGGIEVVAVQPFGNKHKLALVQTCGEKLLIAASDKDVRLLSHVGSDLLSESAAGELPSETERKISESINEMSVSGFTVADSLSPSRLKSSMPKGTVGGNLGFEGRKVSEDLDGLVRLRKENAQIANTEGFLGGMNQTYQRDGSLA